MNSIDVGINSELEEMNGENMSNKLSSTLWLINLLKK